MINKDWVTSYPWAGITHISLCMLIQCVLVDHEPPEKVHDLNPKYFNSTASTVRVIIFECIIYFLFLKLARRATDDGGRY